MSATIELKYFNTFWLKRMESLADVVSGTTSNYVSSDGPEFQIGDSLSEDELNIGQEVSFSYNDPVVHYTGYIIEKGNVDVGVPDSPSTFVLKAAPSPDIEAGFVPVEITFGKIVNFDSVPLAYASNTDRDWLIEESRVRGGYNNTSVDFGVRAYIAEDESTQQRMSNSMIYSGIFNSRTGVNNTNQFSVGEDITRTISPANGSIQKLYAEDTNLIIFQEKKVSRSLINKDAIYSAEGNATITSAPVIIGQNVAFAGEYGISKDPESFAVNGYRKYFADRNQNVVCRLSMDGITVISNYGMVDFFRDKLSSVGNGLITGGWDAHNKQYILSIQQGSSGKGLQEYNTLSFDESVVGWTGLFSYKPNQVLSLNNNYYTTNSGKLYKHYTLETGSTNRSTFYGTTYDSDVTLVFNGNPSLVKNFQTVGYEGDSGWQMDSFITNVDTALPITPNFLASNLSQMQNNMMVNNFKLKEDKYFANLVNDTSSQYGEVLWGQSSSGIKGFYGEVKMKIRNSNSGKKELFAVNTKFVPSSY
jgi:hypothetical protein